MQKRLSIVLAVAMLVPLAAAVAGVGLIGPRVARNQALDAASRDADAAVVALRIKCEAVDDAVTATAREVAAYATKYDGLPAFAAAAAADRAAARRPDSAVAVFGTGSDEPLAVAGAAAGRAPAAAGGYGASCSSGAAGTHPGTPGLSERVPVNTVKGLVGAVVVWVPLDDAALRTLGGALGSTGTLKLTAPQPVPAGRGADRVSGGSAVAVRGAGPGVPYTVTATDPVGAAPTRTLLLVLCGLALVALVILRLLASRLGRPMDAEVAQTQAELARRSSELNDSLDLFSQALGRTHDLDGLLGIVTEQSLHGTGAVAAVVLLDEGPDLLTDGLGLVEHARRLRSNPYFSASDTSAVAEKLVPFAAGAYQAPQFENLALQQFTLDADGDRRGAVPAYAAVAVPLRAAGKLLGVLALARSGRSGGFDARALERLRVLAEHSGTAIANVRKHEEVERLSVTDPLTGVGNVRQLGTTLSKELSGATRRNQPLTVLMLDLDHFKQVNDTLGHPFGDAVLRDVARRLRRCLREEDTVARYGGEEFALVLPGTDLEGGCRVAERVLEAVRAEPVRVGEQAWAITVSVGVATFPELGRTPEQLLGAADAALYRAKRDGRDRWAVAGMLTGEPTVQQAG